MQTLGRMLADPLLPLDPSPHEAAGGLFTPQTDLAPLLQRLAALAKQVADVHGLDHQIQQHTQETRATAGGLRDRLRSTMEAHCEQVASFESTITEVLPIPRGPSVPPVPLAPSGAASPPGIHIHQGLSPQYSAVPVALIGVTIYGVSRGGATREPHPFTRRHPSYQLV